MSIENWLVEELRFSRSYYQPWGRRVIYAIDVDDCVLLAKIFQRKKGYGNYQWGAWMHTFHGDTALHIAFKQNKIKCIYMLLLLHADVSIKNAEGVTASDLCQQMHCRSIHDLRIEAMRKLLEMVEPTSFDFFPVCIPYKGSNAIDDVNHEAWRLMEQGRCLFSDIPDSFKFLDLITKKKIGNPWIRKVDDRIQRAYMYNRLNGSKRWLTPVEEKEVSKFWKKSVDKKGESCFVNELTGMKSNKKPDDMYDSDDEKRDLAEIYNQWDNVDEEEEFEKQRQERIIQADVEIAQKQAEDALRVELEQKEAAALLRHQLGIKEVTEEDIAARLEGRIEHKKIEDTKHISVTAYARTVGDVWIRDDIIDTVNLLINQNRHWKQKEQYESLKKSGLTLKKMNKTPYYVDHISDNVMKSIPSLAGIKKLKFVKVKTLHTYAKSTDADHNKYDNTRWITELSTQTNMKYMNVGNSGLLQLVPHLNNNKYLTAINFSCARVSSSSISVFAKILRSMQALTSLDLSGNAICDIGAFALADACTNNKERDRENANQHAMIGDISSHHQPKLHTLSLLGNRITVVGIQSLLTSICSTKCSLIYLNLSRNRLSKVERVGCSKQVDDFNEEMEQLKLKQQDLVTSSALSIDYSLRHSDHIEYAKKKILL